MKIAFRLSIFVLFLVVSPVFGEMLEPPPQFSSIFSEISTLESSITKGDWETAENKVKKLETLLNEISSLVIKSSGMANHDHLVDSFQSLKKVLKSKDSSLVFDQLVLVEKLLFQTMENFNYLLFPAILIINEQVGGLT